MSIEIEGIERTFGDFAALRGVDLSIGEGEFVALLGPSGSGKTTLLRILAGLEFADRGGLHVDGVDLASVPARDRRMGFVFQHYALFRHMTVAENIAFGLKVRPRGERPAKAEIERRVGELLERVQLPGLGNRYPAQLSGGQRQRVALARALAIEPRILLLDEPFGALDAKVRAEMRVWLRGLQKSLKITTVFVTHDQEEALEIADRVVVMNQGRIEQVGTPQEVYDRPATAFVHEFLGSANQFACTVRQGKAVIDTLGVTAAAEGIADGQARAMFRPDDVEILDRAAEGALPAKLVSVGFAGANVRFIFESVPGAQSIKVSADKQAVSLPDLSVGTVRYLLPGSIRVYSAAA